MSSLSISGAVSGIDTASLVNQLMSVEAAQQTAIKTRQSTAQKAADAYAGLITSLGSLAGKAKALADTSTWLGSTATSTSPSVTATATGLASGTLTFDVTAVAATHALVSRNSVNSPTAVVAAGPLTVYNSTGAQVATIAVGGGSLTEVVNAINASTTAGLQASTVQTSPGQYRLQVTSKTSGAAGAFTMTGITGFTGMDILSQGADAAVRVGTNPATQYTVTSTSNTFAGVIPGLNFTVSKVENGVTVRAAIDGNKVADDVKALVDTANTVLADLAKQTTYDPATKSRGPLFGERAIRQLQQDILATVGAAAAPGVELTRAGRLTFSKDKFLTAFAADPAKVAGAFGSASTFTPTSGVNGQVSVSRAAATVRAGAYAVEVTALANKEQWRADAAGGDFSGKTVVVMRGSTSITYTVGASESLADAVAAINVRMASAGLGVSAAVSSPSIVLTAASAGSAQAFQVTVNNVLGTNLAVGTDAAGSIDGIGVVGNGTFMTLADPTSGADGLTLDVSGITSADTTVANGDVGVLDYKPGFAQRLAGLLDRVTDTHEGALSRAKASRLGDVRNLQDAIESWDRRLEARRLALTKQFTAMETAIATLQSKTTALNGLSTG